VKLTPSLLAKALSQVYLLDLPDFGGANGLPGPAWAQKNPASLLADPAFHALNSEIPTSLGGAPTFPFITGDHSADNQRIWQWIQSDPAAASWLDGGAGSASDPVTADPDYVKLKLGKSPAADQFDEAYTGTLTCADAVTDINQCGGPPDLSKPTSTSCDIPAGDTVNTSSKACTSLDSEALLPVETNFDQAAAAVLAASDSGNTKTWDPSAKASDGTPGWFDTIGTELPGETFMWTVNDMPDLAAYGLLSAALCNPAGADCIQPSTGNVTEALKSATADSAGLLQVNPAKVPAGAYPLVDVVYAAVPTNQSASLLTDYANFISYAAGKGQTAGTAPGDLPPGYLPLTSSLQSQARTVVTKLKTLAAAAGKPSGSPTSSTTSTSPSGGGSHQTTGGSTTTGGGSTTPGGGTTPTTGATAAATCSPAASTSPSASASPSGSASASTPPSASTSSAAAGTGAAGSTACASSSATPQPFSVLPPAAQAASGTTQSTPVGAIRIVLIIVLIVGVSGAVPGIVLRYGRVPRRGWRLRGMPRDT
jgi:hypothetical protein